MNTIAHPMVGQVARPIQGRMARRFAGGLLWLLGGILALILALPVVLLFVATAVPVYLSIGLALLDVALIFALFRLERNWVTVTGFFLGMIAVAFFAVWLSQVYATTPPISDAQGRPLPGSIATLEKVTLNGSEQWISIRGQDVNQPVLLFLAGGPGGSQLATARRSLAGLEEHFVVVNWEQPGAGKSFDAVQRSTLTPERYIADGRELVLYLRQRFGAEKIYVLGESWGSALGVWLVQRDPGWFHAFIGTGQMVDFTKTDVLCYEFALRLAQERGDTRKVEQLERQGPPPYYGKGMVWKQLNYLMDTFAYMNQNPAILDDGFDTFGDLASPEYGLYDKVNWFRGVIDTLDTVFPQLWGVDLRTEAPYLEVPVYFLIGRHDVNAPPALTEDYYELLDAPHKELVWFEHSGHNPWVNESARFVDVMVNTVLAQTQPPAAEAAAIAITPQTMAAYFDAALARQLADEHIVGATVAVVKDGELFFAKGYGNADLAGQTRVTADGTLFFPGSAGKLFTWTAVMQLVEQGQLDLNTDVNQYLDFVIPATFAEPVTLEHLLTHTAGFEEQLEALLVADQADVEPMGVFLRRTLPARVYAPGTTFAYSNYGTVLAGYIVERVSGEPFEQYIADHILTPLEMSKSWTGQPLSPALLADHSKGYHYRNGHYAPVDFEWIAGAPAAPIRTTAVDMAKFMIAHLNGGAYGDGRILQSETADAMHQLQFAHDPRLNGVGYGFMVSEQNGQTIAWHTGGSAHFNTMLALIPAENIGFFLSYNTPVADLYQSLVSFVDHFYPAPPDEAVQPPDGTAQRIAALSGSYVSSRVAYGSPQKLATWQAESLAVRPGSDNTLLVGSRTYQEIEPGLFHQVDGPRRLTYRTDAHGQVTELFFGQFAYFKVPGYGAAGFQLLLASASLLILLVAGPLWLVDWLVRRRRGGVQPSRWAQWARWTAVGFGLFNTALLGWFVVLLLGFADSFVFPAATTTLLTWLWWINLPAVLALVFFTILAWREQGWGTLWRIHYTLVTLAAVLLMAFLMNWNLFAGL
jgi:CubicO group peptidase (beta-lactamase class C family)/pimeloyl-ACP methyl ester carboxylesterase